MVVTIAGAAACPSVGESIFYILVQIWVDNAKGGLELVASFVDLYIII